MGSPKAASVVERLTEAVAKEQTGYDGFPLAFELGDLGALLAVVGAAQEALPAMYEAAGYMDEDGHAVAYSQLWRKHEHLHHALAALHTPDSVGEREAE